MCIRDSNEEALINGCIEPYKTLLHEVGHGLATLGHPIAESNFVRGVGTNGENGGASHDFHLTAPDSTNAPDAIMRAYIDTAMRPSLTADDIQGFLTLYPLANASAPIPSADNTSCAAAAPAPTAPHTTDDDDFYDHHHENDTLDIQLLFVLFALSTSFLLSCIFFVLWEPISYSELPKLSLIHI